MRDSWVCKKVRAWRERRDLRRAEEDRYMTPGARRAILIDRGWLFVITVLVFVALLVFENQQDEITRQADQLEAQAVRIEAVSEQDVDRAREEAAQGRAQVIVAGERAVFQGCMRDIRAELARLRSSNRNVPLLVKEGVFPRRVLRLSRQINRETRKRNTRKRCVRSRTVYRRTALND
jgi:hypothetical protein